MQQAITWSNVYLIVYGVNKLQWVYDILTII